jgi:hypothetical protein
MNPYLCTIYNCKSLNKLQQYFFIKDKLTFKTLSNDLNNNPFKFFKPFKKDNRELFICNKNINNLHKRLIKLFKIEKSTYLKSGVKKESHITNAKHHENANFFLLIDIKRFYPSITKTKIKKQLINTYKQSSNVAEFISNLVTVPQEKSLNKRALVTGSPLSQYFAYVINKKMFDELNIVSMKENIKFSVYVDDMTFSSKQIITYKFHTTIYSILTKYGYLTHVSGDKKNYRGKVGNKSKITGVQFTKYGFRLLDKHKIKIRKIIANNECITKEKTLMGLIHYAIQVNPKYSKYMYIINRHIKQIKYNKAYEKLQPHE